MALDEQRDPRTTPTPVARAQALSRALGEAARRARFSTRSKRNLTTGGFQARRGQRAVRLAIWLSFFVMVVAPTLAAAVYFAVSASDQYTAEAQFTVMGGEIRTNDGFGALTGIPSMAIVQDTQVVTSYVASRAAVEKIDADLNLRNMFGNERIDWLARLDGDASIERLDKYWRKMVTASIKMPSGIIDLRVRAFTPADAVIIATRILSLSEEVINDLNARMNRDAVGNAEAEFRRAGDRLAQTRRDLEMARNSEGVLDAGRASEAVTKLITETRSALVSLQSEYAAQLKRVRDSAPQMIILRNRIDATRGQIAELESQLTESQSQRRSNHAISVSMTRFSLLNLEQQIAERLYAGSAAALELARIAAERQMMYINVFVRPSEAQEARYPHRVTSVFIMFAAAATLWGLLVGLAVLARNNMA